MVTVDKDKACFNIDHTEWGQRKKVGLLEIYG
jgi:hypothetical protein